MAALTGIPVIESNALKAGQVVYGTDLVMNIDRPVIIAHGLTIVWMQNDGQPNEVIHRAAMAWIERRIEMSYQLALDRIANTHLHQGDFRLAHG